MKILCLGPVLFAFLAAGCADPAPPQPDPVEAERLIASLDSEPELPAKIAKKIQKAARVAVTVARISPEKIDPDVAAALIAR